MEYRPIRAIISGGGTGGHIFPAVSIGKKIKELSPGSEILFVGAEGKMEMEKVPAEGFRIIGLPIVGLQRQLNWKNIVNDLKVPFKIMASIHKAGKIIRDFKPDIVVGVGGYASAPLLWKATRMKVPALIQEQNGFAGLTNKILARKAGCICVAYEGMERFFPKDKIVLTGNPIRPEMVRGTEKMIKEGIELYYNSADSKKILVVGGSLGSGTLNRAMKSWIEAGRPGGNGVEVLWQCGRYYKSGIDAFMASHPEAAESIHHSDFIGRMDLAYAAADVIISRSGASSISEICATGKASVLVPSPNVAEDHQTHNAMALVRKDAAIMVRDSEAVEKLLPTTLSLLADGQRRMEMEKNVLALAKREAALDIVNEIYKLINV